MSTFPTCPQCGLENTYSDGALWVCPDCGHEWGDDAPGQAEAGPVVRNGNPVYRGILSLPVQGTT